MKKTLVFIMLLMVQMVGAQEVDTLSIKHPEYLPSIELGTFAPEILAKDTAMTEIRLSDYRGKYVVLDFWATWCGDCRREVPGLKALYENTSYKQIAGKDVQWLSFSFDDKKEQWVTFLRKEQFPWPQVSNLIRTRHDPTFKAYELHWIPAFLVIDPKGRIIGKAITAVGLESELKRIVGE